MLYSHCANISNIVLGSANGYRDPRLPIFFKLSIHEIDEFWPQNNHNYHHQCCVLPNSRPLSLRTAPDLFVAATAAIATAPATTTATTTTSTPLFIVPGTTIGTIYNINVAMTIAIFVSPKSYSVSLHLINRETHTHTLHTHIHTQTEEK